MSAFWDDVDAEQMTHSDEPTDAEEREEWSGTDWCLAWNSEPPGEDVSHECYKAQPNECANEVIDRLSADVKRLETEVKQLEVKGCPQCPHCHPDSRWP